MSDKRVPLAEIQRSQDLDSAIAYYLPDVLKNLTGDVGRKVNDCVYDHSPNPGARIPKELILRQKYDYLRDHGHMKALTQEQIEVARVLSTKQSSFEPKNGTEHDAAGMVV